MQVTRLRRHEWTFVRQKLGRPRRFSQSFLRDDANNLGLQRENIRRLQQGMVVNHQIIHYSSVH